MASLTVAPTMPLLTPPAMPSHPDLAKICAILGVAGAAAVVSLNVVAGGLYIRDCRKEKGSVSECWDRGLAISGLGSGGPLAAIPLCSRLMMDLLPHLELLMEQ